MGRCWRSSWAMALACCAALSAQEAAPAAKAPIEKPEGQRENKPAPKNPVQEFLKSTVEMIPAASLSVQVAALMDAAELYGAEDKAQTLDLLAQAFRTAAAIPPSPGGKLGEAQSQVLVIMANYDPGGAAELLAGLSPKARGFPLFMIVSKLIEQKELERAISILELYSTPEAYPYTAANMVLKELAEDDARRTQIFSAAASSFTTESDIEGFSLLLQGQWRSTPRTVLDPAVHRAVTTVLKMKRPEDMSVTKSTDKGSVTFDNETDAELFDLIGVLQSVDPKGAKEILDQRPSLAAALDRFPDGSASMASSGGDRTSETKSISDMHNSDGQVQEQMRLNAVSDALAEEALKLATDSALAAIKKAKQIPLESIRARTLLQIAQEAVGKDPEGARLVLAQVDTELRGVKNMMNAAQLWAAFAETAAKAKEVELADKAIERGMAACETLYKEDANADDPNIAPREYWPSMQSWRTVMVAAATIHGLEAEPLLARVTDPDLIVMARLAVLRGVLKKPIKGMGIGVQHSKRS
jgi:hypothetical protein